MPSPAAASTLPLLIRVVSTPLGLCSAPVILHVSLAGSYNSAVATPTSLASLPPAISTFPLVSKVAEKPPFRSSLREPVGLCTPVAGSYNVAVRSAPHPPAIRIFPFFRRVILESPPSICIGPLVVHVLLTGSYSSTIPCPSTMSTLPSPSRIPGPALPVAIGAPVTLQLLLVGSYNSAPGTSA